MLRRGFTLIELSIVLVIIGLIVGGVLVGRDLIEAATLRATVGQIEKYDTAVNTFRGKYNVLPGDMTNVQASQFGMQARSGAAGHGDGDGKLTACNTVGGAMMYLGCEDILFWHDLSQANLISESLITATDALAPNLTSSSIPLYLPAAKLAGSYFAVATCTFGCLASLPLTVFSIDGVLATDASSEYNLQPRMTTLQAYAIDSKIDDGKPFSGTVIATQSAGVSLYNINSGPTECKTISGAYNTTYDTPTCGLLIRMSSWPQ